MSAQSARHFFQGAQHLWGPLVVGAGYFLGAEAAFAVGTLSDDFFAPLWPPNIVLFWTLLLVPYSRWWAYLAVVFPVHVLVEWQVAMPPLQIIVAFATNCAVAVLNVLFVRWVLVSPPWLNSFPRAVLYIVGTVCISPAAVAFGGAFVRIMAEGQWHSYWTHWMQWYASNALGALALGPFLLVLVDRRISRSAWPSHRRVIEALLLAGALACTCALAAKVSSSGFFAGILPILLYFPLLLVLWSAVRFGVLGASGATLIVTVAAIWMMLSGVTVLGSANPETNVLAFQLFLTGFAIPVLLLGACIEGLHEAQRTVRELAQSLLWSHDQEKRRTAKQLHEGICQELAGTSLKMTRLAHLMPDNLKQDIQQLEIGLRNCMHDLQSASYLLHPPLLEESGLGTALRSFVDGFARDTCIEVDLAVSANVGRLAPDIEITVFRVVQDALNDISRRPRSLMADIRIELCDTNVVVTIAEDNMARTGRVLSLLGRAVAVPFAKPSLGMASMRERLYRIGGKLEVEAVGGRTIIRAIIQLAAR